MSQPNHAVSDDQLDPELESDPLLAFLSERATPPTPARNPAEPGAKTDDPSAGSSDESTAELRRRLDQSERSLERALMEITTLKSDVATLVGTLDDIKKRMSRRPDAVAMLRTAPRTPRFPALNTFAVAIFLLAALALWGLFSIAAIEVPSTPRVEASTTVLPEDAAAGSPSKDREASRADTKRSITSGK